MENFLIGIFIAVEARYCSYCVILLQIEGLKIMTTLLVKQVHIGLSWSEFVVFVIFYNFIIYCILVCIRVRLCFFIFYYLINRNMKTKN